MTTFDVDQNLFNTTITKTSPLGTSSADLSGGDHSSGMVCSDACLHSDPASPQRFMMAQLSFFGMIVGLIIPHP